MWNWFRLNVLVNFCSTFCQSTEPRDGRAEAAGGGAEDGERVPAPPEGHELQREDQGADGEVHPGDGVRSRPRTRSLKTEKDKEEAKHDEELAETMEKHAKELQDLGTRPSPPCLLL